MCFHTLAGYNQAQKSLNAPSITGGTVVTSLRSAAGLFEPAAVKDMRGGMQATTKCFMHGGYQGNFESVTGKMCRGVVGLLLTQKQP